MRRSVQLFKIVFAKLQRILRTLKFVTAGNYDGVPALDLDNDVFVIDHNVTDNILTDLTTKMTTDRPQTRTSEGIINN